LTDAWPRAGPAVELGEGVSHMVMTSQPGDVIARKLEPMLAAHWH